MTTENKSNFLSHHLHYEYNMLCKTRELLNSTDQGLFYNIFYESFIIHARNLYKFLRNDDKQNYGAKDFSQTFTASKYENTWLQKIEPQVFHMGKKRPSENSGKFNKANANEMFRWIENNYNDFRNKIDQKYKKYPYCDTHTQEKCVTSASSTISFVVESDISTPKS